MHFSSKINAIHSGKSALYYNSKSKKQLCAPLRILSCGGSKNDHSRISENENGIRIGLKA